jgi:hypothetical protein
LQADVPPICGIVAMNVQLTEPARWNFKYGLRRTPDAQWMR